MSDPKAAIIVSLMPPSSKRWSHQMLCFGTLQKQIDCEIIVADIEQTGLANFCKLNDIKRVYDIDILEKYKIPFVKNFLEKCLNRISKSVKYVMWCAGDYYYLTDDLVDLLDFVAKYTNNKPHFIMAHGYNVELDADVRTGCIHTRVLNLPGVGTWACSVDLFRQMVLAMPKLAYYEWGVERWMVKWMYENKILILDASFEFRALHKKHKPIGFVLGESLSKVERAELYVYQLAFSDNIDFGTWINKFKRRQINTWNGLSFIVYGF